MAVFLAIFFSSFSFFRTTSPTRPTDALKTKTKTKARSSPSWEPPHQPDQLMHSSGQRPRAKYWKASLVWIWILAIKTKTSNKTNATFVITVYPNYWFVKSLRGACFYCSFLTSYLNWPLHPLQIRSRVRALLYITYKNVHRFIHCKYEPWLPGAVWVPCASIITRTSGWRPLPNLIIHNVVLILPNIWQCCLA